jgi:hypothetical protein
MWDFHASLSSDQRALIDLAIETGRYVNMPAKYGFFATKLRTAHKAT